MDTKKLAEQALKQAAKEAAAYKSAVIAADVQAECIGISEPNSFSKVSTQQSSARSRLDAKIDSFLQSQGIDTSEAKKQSDDNSGLKLKNQIIEKVEQEGHKDARKKLHPTGEEVAVCPATPGAKPASTAKGRV